MEALRANVVQNNLVSSNVTLSSTRTIELESLRFLPPPNLIQLQTTSEPQLDGA